MVSQKGVRTRRCALFPSCTHHKEKLTIRHVMEISPLRVVTGIAHGARAMPACAGFRRGNANCSPPAMSTLSSRYRENSPHSRCRTNS
jgi:hypothetical protein